MDHAGPTSLHVSHIGLGQAPYRLCPVVAQLRGLQQVHIEPVQESISCCDREGHASLTFCPHARAMGTDLQRAARSWPGGFVSAVVTRKRCGSGLPAPIAFRTATGRWACRVIAANSFARQGCWLEVMCMYVSGRHARGGLRECAGRVRLEVQAAS